MNKVFVVTIGALILCACLGKHNSDAQKARVSEESTEFIKGTTGDTIPIDPAKSHVYWKGTKMQGAGKHEGEVELKTGYFIIKDGQVVNGAFVVDMTTLGVTDIPKEDPIPIKNLNTHLRSADFFRVEKFPTAKFQITKINQITPDEITVSGNLTLKDITKNIEFQAKYQNKLFTTKFTFNRFQWNIAYVGLVEKTMVDKDIEMNIVLTFL